ncbi:grasp-with-spasm system SPASM domain peptide maturase [Chryseobacterium indologenes]|uniref:grasp-with-spasm system SPASM domain peptide maturase n=1 Tax=Chryseobacterium indologenes TaxID=253 RepID=UPI0010312E0C|nr:grasp-with-spasm system SPASM domain peptide maturase [Chryseobacterium indologenes]
MKKTNNYIYMYSCCFVVQGNNQSIICDVQRKNYEIIPNTLFEILNNLNIERNLDILKESYTDKEDKEIFDSYITFLLDEEFIFIDDSLHNRFPAIDLTYDSPNLISNAIIEIGASTSFELLLKNVKLLDKMRCESVELRFYEHYFEKEYENILPIFQSTGIRSLRLLINYFDFPLNFFKTLGRKYKRIRELYICANTRIQEYESPYFPVIQLANKKVSSIFCGCISDFYFSPELKNFTESHHYNSCLHKKIAIDQYGNIKNCPSMSHEFGNIKDTTLEVALHNPEFTKYWNLTKDKIEVCKDCEFRYICTDCRAYTERTHNNKNGLDISKPLKCGYDPYTGEWNEWSKNPMKQKAIRYYRLSKLVEE